MKIHGIGTDIVKISRIKKTINKKSLLTRLFNKDEISKCKKMKNISSCFAKRFAAKEAFSKALGTGIAKGINFKEIVILKKRPINTNKTPKINLILNIVKQNIPASIVFHNKLGTWYKKIL